MVLIWLGIFQIQVIKYVKFEKTNDRNYDFADIAVYFTGIPQQATKAYWVKIWWKIINQG